jgi:hypothetical protein
MKKDESIHSVGGNAWLRMLVQEVLRYERRQHLFCPPHRRRHRRAHLTVQRSLLGTNLRRPNLTNRRRIEAYSVDDFLRKRKREMARKAKLMSCDGKS